MALLQVAFPQRERLIRINQHEVRVVARHDGALPRDAETPGRHHCHELGDPFQRQAASVVTAIEQDG